MRYTYADLQKRLKALKMVKAKTIAHSTPHHLWVNPEQLGRAVTIPDLDSRLLEESLIDEICEKLGISRERLDQT